MVECVVKGVDKSALGPFVLLFQGPISMQNRTSAISLFVLFSSVSISHVLDRLVSVRCREVWVENSNPRRWSGSGRAKRSHVSGNPSAWWLGASVDIRI